MHIYIYICIYTYIYIFIYTDDVLLAHLKAEVSDERLEFIKARRSPQNSPTSRSLDEPGFPAGFFLVFWCLSL